MPKNLVVIGTMNTADRSVGQMDYALRRRFSFFPLLPDPIKVRESSSSDKKSKDEQLKALLPPFPEKTFSNVLSLFVKDPKAVPIDWSIRANTLSQDFQPSDVAIGHTYFLKDDWETQFQHKVLPMLVEYIKDGVLLGGTAMQKQGETPTESKSLCRKIEKVFFENRTALATEAVTAFNSLFP